MTIDELAPERGRHMIVIGQNGTGKSFAMDAIALARARHAPSVVVFDTKEDEENYRIGYVQVANFDMLQEAGAKGTPRIKYTPSESERDDPRIHNAFFEWVYKRKNTVAIVDEVLHVTYRLELPTFMRHCLTRGRGKGISLIMGTQWPKNAPVACFAEARQTICFYLNLEDHRKRVAEWMPVDPDAIGQLPERKFYFHRQGMRRSSGPHVLVRAENGSREVAAA